jgi:hypothetical protein
VGSAAVGAAPVGVDAVGQAGVAAGPGTKNPGAPAGRATARALPGDTVSLDRVDGELEPGTLGLPPRGEEVAGGKAGAQSPAETFTSLRGAGSELRKQVRTRRRLRVIMLVSLAVVVLVVLPAIFGLRSVSKDPIFRSLDDLAVPSWANTGVTDESSGSRWCFLDCTLRERVVQSDRPFKETTQVYTSALKKAGWAPWTVAECPEQPIDPASGTYSCFRRDEFTLDLSVRLPECAVDQIAAANPATLPSAAAAPVDPAKCVGSTVSIKVLNAIFDTRGKPEPKQSPDLVGETPDPVLSDDPLLNPTPKAS